MKFQFFPHSQGIFTMTRSQDPDKAVLWQQRLVDFQASSMTVAEYCKSVSCSVAAFYQWRRKLSRCQPPTVSNVSTSQPSSPPSSATSQRRSSTLPSRQTAAFLPVTLRSSAVVVTLTNGTRLELACDPHNALQSILQQPVAGQ
jgi:hypothetical protein